MTENQPPRPVPPAPPARLGSPESNRTVGPRRALRRSQRDRRLFSIVVAILLVLSFVVFLVTEFMQPHPFNL